MSETIWYGIVGLGLLLTGIIIGVMMQTGTDQVSEPIVQVDYSDRFNRLDVAMINHTLDICFQWGGQWITDQNNLVIQDFDIPLQDGLFTKGQVIMCVRQSQEVQ